MKPWKRMVVLAVASVLTAALCLVASLASTLWRLPESDLAYGQSVGEALRDPFVLAVATPVTAVFGGMGFVAACILLWRTDLRRSVPLVLGVSLLTAALVPHPLLAAPLATLAGLLAMLVCWRPRYRRRSMRAT